ncbi:MAG TPA: YfiR family protein [Candidatus Aminicenantes bacterium]|nr:YfiR family protein [Candidatus Aminicenantes bacterium]
MKTARFRIGWILAAAGAVFLSGPPAVPAGKTLVTDTSASEAAVKAVFLYHFIRYLQWPGEFDREPCPIVVLGDSAIWEPLQEISEKKTNGSVLLLVRRCEELKDAGRPRILFLSDSSAFLLPEALEKFRGTSVIVVGETEGLARRGAAINFVLRDEHVKFEINLDALKQAGIQAGSQLLRLALLVEGDKAAPGR